MASVPVFSARRTRAGRPGKGSASQNFGRAWAEWRLEGGRGLNARPWPFWVNMLALYPAGTPASPSFPASSANLVRLWALALQARRIPHRLAKAGSGRGIFVPALYAGLALHEMKAMERESHKPCLAVQTASWPFPGMTTLGHPHSVQAALVLALMLLLLHLLRWPEVFQGFIPNVSLPSPPFPPGGSAWARAFGLDPFRTLHRMEWWRSITALGLHGSLAHLVSNMVFGGLFMALLVRRTGVGAAFALAILGGGLGNVFNALVSPPQTLSIGFSTAVFALIGASSVYSCLDIAGQTLHHQQLSGFRPRVESVVALARPVVGPLMAGLAFLALLGGAGSHGVDYGAHIMGLAAGALWGVLFHWGEKRLWGQMPQKPVSMFWSLVALVIFAGAWALALT